MRVKSFLMFLVTALLVGSSAGAGTLVFPPTSSNNTQCAPDLVSNNCGTVSFNGGHFVTNNGTTTYSGGTNFDTCVSGQVGWTFLNGAATDLTAVIENDAYENQTLKIETTDLVDGVFVTRTQMLPFPGRDPHQPGSPSPSTSVQTSGRAIDRVLITILNQFGQVNFSETAWQVLSMSVTQPVPPTVELSIARNGDGTFAATIRYFLPTQSAASSRSLSLELLPEGKEPGSTYFTQTDLSGSGVVVAQLGSFDTDRMIRAYATACDGSDEAEASVSGCGECKGPTKAVGGPVRLFDGVMTYGETDPLPATLGTEFRRQYASSNVTDGTFGTGWTSLFDASALPLGADGASVSVVTEDRTSVVFRHISTGEWLQKWPMGGVAGTLTGSEQDGYTFREAGGSIVRTFGTNHRLIRLQDLRRNRAVTITYDVSGNPTQIADERGNWSCDVATSGGHVTAISVTGSPAALTAGAGGFTASVGAQSNVIFTWTVGNGAITVVDASTLGFSSMAEVDDGKPVCVVVPSDGEVSMKKLASAFGGKTAKMMRPQDAERLTGYHVGGISPFGQKKRVQAAIEQAALNCTTVFVNGGQRGLQIEIDPNDAAIAAGAVAHELSA